MFFCVITNDQMQNNRYLRTYFSKLKITFGNHAGIQHNKIYNSCGSTVMYRHVDGQEPIAEQVVLCMAAPANVNTSTNVFEWVNVVYVQFFTFLMRKCLIFFSTLNSADNKNHDKDEHGSIYVTHKARFQVWIKRLPEESYFVLFPSAFHLT